MIIPPLCQTCGQPVGQLWSTYVQLVQKYAAEGLEQSAVVLDLPEGRGIQTGNRGRSRQKAVGGTQEGTNNYKNKGSPEYRALAELAEKHGYNPERVCCRFMFLCNHDISDIIH